MALQSVVAQQRKIFKLVMRTTGEIQLHDQLLIPFHGFADSKTASPNFPASTIRVNEGDTVDIEATNISQSQHTMHLYGLDVNTSNDGDPLTSFELDHRQKYTYRFIARHAGTYLYHCHSKAVVNVALGMYGLLIVTAAQGKHTAWTNGPNFDAEYTWIASEMDTSWNNNPPQQDTISGTVTIPSFVPTYFLLNGKSDPTYSLPVSGVQHSAIYFRLANMGYNDNHYIFPSFLNVFIIDSDGRPLPQASKQDSLIVSPGERYGVIFYPKEARNATIFLQYINLYTNEIVGRKKISINITSPALAINGITEQEVKINQSCYSKTAAFTSTKWITSPAILSIYNVYGVLVQRLEIYHGMPLLQANLDLDQLGPGIYSIATQIGDIKLWHKFSKEN